MAQFPVETWRRRILQSSSHSFSNGLQLQDHFDNCQPSWFERELSLSLKREAPDLGCKLSVQLIGLS